MRVRRPETHESELVIELKPQFRADAFACAATLVPKGRTRYMSRHIRKGAQKPPTEEREQRAHPQPQGSPETANMSVLCFVRGVSVTQCRARRCLRIEATHNEAIHNLKGVLTPPI